MILPKIYPSQLALISYPSAEPRGYRYNSGIAQGIRSDYLFWLQEKHSISDSKKSATIGHLHEFERRCTQRLERFSRNKR